MRGIDISNWQSDIVPSRMNVDFVICKATEGKNFVDKCCDKFVQDCIKNKIPWGFYHFARKNDPEVEAEFFYKTCKNYFNHGIPVLDYEVQNTNNVEWCEKFLQKLYNLSGVWALIYLSASRCKEYKNSWIPNKCGLWVAGYPKLSIKWINDKMPYNISPFKNAVIWQFTNSLLLNGYSSYLDGNLAYIDREQWAKYANSKEVYKKIVSKSTDDLVLETILGEYGTGETRKKMLGNDYNRVQKRLNELYKIADEVIKGKWSNGEKRKTRLNNSGYPYDIIQKIINIKLGGK